MKKVFFPPGIVEELGGVDTTRDLVERLLAYSAAAREGCEDPEPDYACGGIEVDGPIYLMTNDPMPQHYNGPVYVNPNAVWGTIETPDLMSAVRDIARSS